MTAQARLGLLVIFVILLAQGLLIVLIAGPGDAKAIANCTLQPTTLPDDNHVLRSAGVVAEEQTFGDTTQDVIAQAERYVCHEVRSPDETRGWKLQGIDAFRMQIQGNFSWRVHLRYTQGPYSTPRARYLVLVVQEIGPSGPAGPLGKGILSLSHSGAGTEQVWVGSQPAELSDQPDNGVTIRWQQEGLSFEADLEPAQGAPELLRSELLAFLSTVD